MIGYVVGVLLLLGGGFAVIAGLGVLRLPDVLVRMHASTKAGTLACGLIIAAGMVFFADLPVLFRGGLIVGFLMLTAPVAAHMIGRAALRTGAAPQTRDMTKKSG
ncbi:monovalent cation/H(+) antiporter subunit G [Oceaniglobus trochenteri]|uniref:monovalent cation/H(+) antiporter subunit G n=1 Tax=Oceaniglobus trochenteri TaxID=2763260 RepID=UPI001CFF6DF6|nr:monovalent cation/H(+) antiporter subunit G [Oceaniglobus trochenteri]